MIEQPKIMQEGERAILVKVDFGELSVTYLENLSEFKELVRSAGIQDIAVIECKRQRADAAFFVGTGKAEEIKTLVQAEEAELIIFDHTLSPVQQRNLERFCQARVVDRTGLILDIFAQRARSYEGKLQVELAQLEYLSTRLVKSWTHLERQRGGIGLRGGPGETQLEVDRRLLRERVKGLKEKLHKLERQRSTQRRARHRGQVFSVSLVGYTNAGKSTLFNTLTHANIYAADQLFATLDTTSRRLFLATVQREIVLSDTVGFIRDLPHTLVEAFKATLEETVHADLLLHIVDASNPQYLQQIAEVNKVLTEIGADQIPQVLVMNKMDRLDPPMSPQVRRNEQNQFDQIWLSALTGEGLDLLREVLSEWHLITFPNLKPYYDA